MIDTDKYEGHAEGPWFIMKKETKKGVEKYYLFGQRPDYVDEQYPMYDGYGFIAQIIPKDGDNWPNPSIEQDILLIGDTHLLLEEVKRLREIEREWRHMWDKLEDYPDICAELICFMESEEE
tara:strand:- start:4817 stop:5182 length:366 start_codon:yes stop_codon:yes gene_type:complete